jgi:hypothetical protein
METATQYTLKSVRPQPDRLTRDRQLVGFVGRHGVVTIEHLMNALGVGRASAYRRAAHCIDRDLLERLELLRREPSVLRATRRGLRFAQLGGMPVAEVSATSVDHWLCCASTALVLAREPGVDRILTERELILADRIEGRPIASARVGSRPDGGPRFHRPDLVILPRGFDLASASSSIRPIAIEVELSGKGQRRLEQIIRGWRRADSVGEVRYYCAPGPVMAGVERAVRKLQVADRVQVLEVPR